MQSTQEMFGLTKTNNIQYTKPELQTQQGMFEFTEEMAEWEFRLSKEEAQFWDNVNFAMDVVDIATFFTGGMARSTVRRSLINGIRNEVRHNFSKKATTELAKASFDAIIETKNEEKFSNLDDNKKKYNRELLNTPNEMFGF